MKLLGQPVFVKETSILNPNKLHISKSWETGFVHFTMKKLYIFEEIGIVVMTSNVYNVCMCQSIMSYPIYMYNLYVLFI